MATHTLSHGTLVIGEGNIRFFPIMEEEMDTPTLTPMRTRSSTDKHGMLVYVNNCGADRSTHHAGDKLRK
jgi:hypothetical protein